MSDLDVDLGPCGICGASCNTTRSILTLNRRAPVPGTGWGCFICGLPNDGAIAVVCDACLLCLATLPEPNICFGYIAHKKRIAPDAYPNVPFEHIRSKHEEVKQ